MKKKKAYSKKGASDHSRKKHIALWISALTLGGMLIIAGYMVYFCGKEEPYQKDSPLPKIRQKTEVQDGTLLPVRTEKRAAFVIDDMGYDLSIFHEILALDIPVTISILPHLPHATTIAVEAYGAGREVMLHLPMEPHGYPERNPGRGVLLLEMNNDELLAQLREDIRNVPHITGVNNHMGSSFMENEKKVEVVLRELKRRGLFFLDSLTTNNSKGVVVAERIGLPHVGRDIFLDNDCEFEKAMAILRRIIEKREEWKTMVIIGHPYESTVRAIDKSIDIFRRNGIRIVPLSALVD